MVLMGCSGQKSSDAHDAGGSGARILSVYHGLDALPDGVSLLCPTMVGGSDGMPVVFSVQLDHDTLAESVLAVETADATSRESPRLAK